MFRKNLEIHFYLDPWLAACICQCGNQSKIRTFKWKWMKFYCWLIIWNYVVIITEAGRARSRTGKLAETNLSRRITGLAPSNANFSSSDWMISNEYEMIRKHVIYTTFYSPLIHALITMSENLLCPICHSVFSRLCFSIFLCLAIKFCLLWASSFGECFLPNWN